MVGKEGGGLIWENYRRYKEKPYLSGDWSKECVLARDDYKTRYGKDLAENEDEFKGFIKTIRPKSIIKTRDLVGLIENLKIIAIAKKNISKKNKMGLEFELKVVW